MEGSRLRLQLGLHWAPGLQSQPSAVHSGLCSNRSWQKKRGWLQGAELIPTSQVLLEDAKELGANEAGEEVRKSMEDADNTASRVTLPLPSVVAISWEGLTGRFWEGQ